MDTVNGWVVRPERADDVPAVRAVVAAAFETPAEAALVDALRDDPQAWIGALSIVGCTRQGHVVAHALLSRCHIGLVPALCLAPCAVLPSHQGRGAGSAAIAGALARARALDEDFVVVLGHPDYYRRFGFTTASAAGITVPLDAPEEASLARSLGDRPLPAGIVRYAAAFGIAP